MLFNADLRPNLVQKRTRRPYLRPFARGQHFPEPPGISAHALYTPLNSDLSLARFVNY